MQNAFLGTPFDYTVMAATTAGLAGTDPNFLKNDEPGLVYSPNTGGAVTIAVDLGVRRNISFVSLLGISEQSFNITVQGSNASDFSTINALFGGVVRSNFSTTRSSPGSQKFLYTYFPTSNLRYLRLQIAAADAAKIGSPWRLLVGDVIQPGENLSIGAEEGIDDRSNRRYARNGRRVIDPTVIVPTFQGTWPWLTTVEMQEFRTYMRQYGATKPAFLCLDPQMDTDSAHGGEDGIFYGDFEKSTKISYDEGTYGFTVAVAAIAP